MHREPGSGGGAEGRAERPPDERSVERPAGQGERGASHVKCRDHLGQGADTRQESES